MKKYWKKKWIEALRRGAYKQTQGTLRLVEGKKKPSFCCLGVLCDLPANSRWNDEDKYVHAGTVTVGSHGDLDQGGRDKFGISHDEMCTLIRMNDDEGASFKKIAKYIEKNL